VGVEGLGRLISLGILLLVYVPRATLYWVLLLFMWGLGQLTLLGTVGLCGVSSNTSLGIVVVLCGVLLLVYVGYCCWFMWGIVVGLCGVLLLFYVGYCCWFMWGIVVGYVAPRATHVTGLVGILFLVYEGPRTIHFTGYC
jgi:hypothetical protein